MTRSRPFSGIFPFYSQHLLFGAALAVHALPAQAEPSTPKTAVSPQVTVGAEVKTKPSARVQANSPAKSEAPTAQAAAATPAVSAAAPAAPLAADPALGASAELDAGRAAYVTGDYLAASEHFSKAQGLADTAEAQYWLAMSLDLQGRTADAYKSFEKLAISPKLGDLSAEQQTQAKARFEVLSKIPATVEVNVTPATAGLTVDGIAQTGSAPFTLKLTAGKHTLSASGTGYEASQAEIEVSPAETRSETLTLKANVTAAPPPASVLPAPAAPPAKNLVPAYITLGVAGASAIVGGIFGVSALNAKSDFKDQPTSKHADDVERNALIADMAFGVALTLGITGIVLLTTDEPTDVGTRGSGEHHAELRLTPYVSPTSAGASALLRF